MICVHCKEESNDVIVMHMTRFVDGELYSYASQPHILCLDCYKSISLGKKIFDDLKEEEETECQS